VETISRDRLNPIQSDRASAPRGGDPLPKSPMYVRQSSQGGPDGGPGLQVGYNVGAGFVSSGTSAREGGGRVLRGGGRGALDASPRAPPHSREGRYEEVGAE